MKENFKENILSKIEEEKIAPIPKSYFKNRNRILWISIILIIIFWIIFSWFLIDDTSEMIWMRNYGWWMWILFLPNIFWLILIFILIFAWINNIKKTPTGHRNSYLNNIIIWIIILFFWSFLFRYIWFWPSMHSYMINNIPWVSSVLYNEWAWNNPSNWRLAWEIIDIWNNQLKLKSLDWKIWNIDITDSFISPMTDIELNDKIRILGLINWNLNFKSDRIMPRFGRWMWNGWMMWWYWNWGWRWMMR